MTVVARTEWNGPAVASLVQSAARQASLAAGSVVQVELKRNLLARKGPSVPGQYPGWRTRNLAMSQTVEPLKDGRLGARVGSPVFYGRILELKVGKGSRPWLARTFIANQARARVRFEEVIRRRAGGGR